MPRQKFDTANEALDASGKEKVAQIITQQTSANPPQDDCQFVTSNTNKSVLEALENIWLEMKRKNGEEQEVSGKPREARWEDLLQPYGSILGGVLAVSTVGAGFTFSIIFTTFADPRPGFTQDYVRNCIAASWLLFIASIGITNTMGLTSDIVTRLLSDTTIRKGPKHTSLGALVSAQATSLILLPAGAFLSSAEAVRAYSQPIGIAAHVLVVSIALALLAATAFYCIRTLNRFGSEDSVTTNAAAQSQKTSKT